PEGPVVVPLSAPSVAQLRASAHALAAWVEGEGGLKLADIAQTLIFGREQMPERLAVCATSPDVLCARLHAFTAGETEGLYVGRAGAAAQIASPEDPSDVEHEAHHFVVGGALKSIDGGRRISLPGTPLCRERFWLAPAVERGPSARRLHPLIDANTSTLDGASFCRSFSSADAWLRDHRFAGKMVLPGVVVLEMARAAATLAAPGRAAVTALRNIMWLRPLTLPLEDAQVDATLRLSADDAGAQFELVSADGTHARGTAVFAAAPQPERIHLAAIKARCDSEAPGETSYHVLAAHALEYGPSLRVLQTISSGPDDVLARLLLPEPPDADYALHPAALDGALQSLAALPLLPGNQPALPFSVDDITWTGAPLPSRLYAHARRAADGRTAADICLCDDNGDVLVRLFGVGVRAVAPALPPDRTERALPDTSNSSEQPADLIAAPILTLLTDLLAAELRLDANRIDPKESFERYGLQSVQVMDMTAALETEFGPLPKTLFFEHNNLADLASYFLAEHADVVTARYPAASPTIDATTAQQDAAQVGASGGGPIPSHGAASVGRAEAGDEGAIAIVGLAGRYPGAADLAVFFDNLRAGHDAITEVPADRWDPAEVPATAEGKSVGRWGGWLSDADRFDARFFKIAPREAALLDPQERLFLETVWQALEDAALTRAALKDAKVGVYVGVMHGLYQLHGPALSSPGRPVAPGSAYWSIANRVSAFCDFKGPSMAVDTACSASLTAIHLASTALRTGEADVAVAGGVNIASHVQKYVQLAELNFTSSDGRCRAFGEGGDGYVPGEGVGAVVLKPLGAALADGDPIRAVLRGSALNHGGATNGYTVPTPVAQAEAITAALSRAGLGPDDIDVVEAHGTGTSLGDPIEIRALNRAFAARRDPRPAPIGSVKSNIGHLEAAAGIAGLTKLVLQLGARTLVPSLHGEPANPDVDFAGGPFALSRQAAPWPAPQGGRPRRAGLSSFGAGGSNAHLIVEEAPPRLPSAPRRERNS
ncbi:MAG: beta-ketoacyl synthase N-terminal-like domain-containing protein, partial [Pseudomonadota bacterium]